MRNNQNRKHNLISLIFVLIFLFAFIASCPFSWQAADQRYFEKVEGETPQWFPILAITPDNVKVIEFSEIENFTKTNPNCSFLVPQGKADYYNQKLIDNYKLKGIDSSPKLEVTQISPDKQSIKLGFYGDGATVVWYDASDKQVSGKSYKMYGSMFIIFPMFYSLIIAAIASGFLYGVWRIYKGTRQNV